jgi:hypothetical protein
MQMKGYSKKKSPLSIFQTESPRVDEYYSAENMSSMPIPFVVRFLGEVLRRREVLPLLPDRAFFVVERLRDEVLLLRFVVPMRLRLEEARFTEPLVRFADAVRFFAGVARFVVRRLDEPALFLEVLEGLFLVVALLRFADFVRLDDVARFVVRRLDEPLRLPVEES